MYLYCAINKEGNLVDVYLSDTRDKKAAEAFFKSCEVTTGIHHWVMTLNIVIVSI